MMNGEDQLCLEGDFAEPFMKLKVGDRVPIELDAVLISAERRPSMDAMPMDPDSKGNGKKPTQKAYVKFVLRSVNGAGENKDEAVDEKDDYANMPSEMFEKRVAKNRGYPGG